jgi:universal stress protein A
MLLFKRILCPTDFSEPSYKALKAADELAKEFRSELILLHVLSPIQAFPAASGFGPSMPVSGAYLPEDFMRTLEKHATESLEMTVKEKVSGEVKSKSVLLNGIPAEEIVRYAEESNSSVIIMGTHGFTGWRHMLLGSVAEKVVRMALCPVLTIPPK